MDNGRPAHIYVHEEAAILYNESILTMTLRFISRHQIDTTMPLISYSLAKFVEYPSY